MKSSAATVQQYLAELPEDRRAVVEAVREMVRHNLPEGYSESMRWSVITYEVPLERYPKTHNGQPLAYLAIAAQKNYYALYLTCVQGSEQEARLREGFKKAGKKLDMGKSCLRFKKLDDLPMNVLAEEVAGTPPDAFIAQYEAARQPDK
ncbi:MAG: hypothetical protein QOH06_3241 [Acidobacteriota bacterium]|nr:hypothetical protein [Acidobacteriota bacterium]